MASAHVVTELAARKRPDLLTMRPPGVIEGVVWDALVVLDAPTAVVVAHWADVSVRQAAKAMERLQRRGLIEGVGLVPGRKGGRWQTYRLVRHA